MTGFGSAAPQNFGAHNAAGNHQWTLKVYAALLVTWVKAARSWRAAGMERHVMWLPSPYLPLRDDGGVRLSKDWRTMGRISLFNQVAAGNSLPLTTHCYSLVSSSEQ